MVGLQVAIVFIGSKVFEIKAGGLNGTQWAISIVVSLFCLPWGVVVRIFPDEWFAVAANFVGYPFVVVYKAVTSRWETFRANMKAKRKA